MRPSTSVTPISSSKPRKTKIAETNRDIGASYNKYKEFKGKQYTGMKIGRSHKWYYDQGTWKERKITPDKWEINYTVTKRRAGKAPEGSGVPVGTEYHWYILSHQHVKKLNANDYTTSMEGLKFKVAHKRYDKEKWNISEKAQKKRLIRIFQEMIRSLELELGEERRTERKAVTKRKSTASTASKKSKAEKTKRAA